MNSGIDEIAGITAFRATLEIWRATGDDRVDPIRFHVIDALERRAASYDGDARRLLDERLGELIANYSADILRAQAKSEANGERAATEIDSERNAPAAANTMPTQSAPCRGPLSELVDLLTSRAVPAAIPGEERVTRSALRPPRPDTSSDLPLLDYFRETWSRVSVDKQLRQSLEQVPDNAGPLNSNGLVHRALTLMRELSPGYLQQFLSYVEALSWMEELAGPVAGTGAAAAAVAATEIPSPTGAKKRARAKAR